MSFNDIIIMDALYFNTENKNSLLSELGVPIDFNGIYESPNQWVLVWLGKLPEKTIQEEDENGLLIEEVIEWKEGEFFNIYLIGQDNMDYFTQELANATLLKEPLSPNHKLS